MNQFDNFEAFEASKAPRTWSGKPLPKDATELKFELKVSQTSATLGAFQLLASVPGFSNQKGKPIAVNTSGWEKTEEDKLIQEKVFSMIEKYLNTPEAKNELETFIKRRVITSRIARDFGI